jgi:hypothetical protein
MSFMSTVQRMEKISWECLKQLFGVHWVTLRQVYMRFGCVHRGVYKIIEETELFMSHKRHAALSSFDSSHHF